MCIDPATATLLMTVASAGASAMQTQETHAAQKATSKATTEAAKKAAQDEYDALAIRTQQEKASASRDAQNAATAGLKARGTERASQGEAGVTGLSTTAVLGDLYRQEGEYRSGVQTSLDYSLDNLKANGNAAQARGQSNINSRPMPSSPNFLEAGARILGAANDFRLEL